MNTPFQKGKKMYSIVRMKCPRCHEVDMFRSPIFPKFRLFDMHEKCPRCGQSFILETGFYWGAMYISYAYSSGALLIVAGVCFLVLHLGLIPSLIAMSITAVLGFAPNARLARTTWINFFVHYDENWQQKRAEN